jgi:hypothetical protein
MPRWPIQFLAIYRREYLPVGKTGAPGRGDSTAGGGHVQIDKQLIDERSVPVLSGFWQVVLILTILKKH